MRYSMQLSAAKNYLLGLLTAALFLFAGLYFYSGKNPETAPEVAFSDTESRNVENREKFNPNNLNESDWKSLGFSDKQIVTLLNYKSSLGGSFSSKEEFQKCYAVSDDKYRELESLIILPEKTPLDRKYSKYQQTYERNYSSNYQQNQLTIPGKFNPDYYSEQDFINLGFSEKQAKSLIKYKMYLGGSFESKEKFRACYMVSTQNYQILAPYLLLPEKSGNSHAPGTAPKFADYSAKDRSYPLYQPFDPNSTDAEGWQTLGFTSKQAQVIINYRDRNLKGKFRSLEDIAGCFVISKEKFDQLRPFILLDAKVFSEQDNNSAGTKKEYVGNKSSSPKEEKTNFNNLDINQITFNQLTEFGFDEKSAASLIGFRNKLGGFVTRQQITETYNIDIELAQKLVKTAPLLTHNIAKYTLADAPEAWLKNHPYFKYFADRIIFYRITYSDDRKILKLLKVKPEAEQKMKLYLK